MEVKASGASRQMPHLKRCAGARRSAAVAVLRCDRDPASARGKSSPAARSAWGQTEASIEWKAATLLSVRSFFGFDVPPAGGLTILRRVGRGALREGRHGGHGEYVATRRLRRASREASRRGTAWLVAVRASARASVASP